MYNKSSGMVEAIPFTTKRQNSTNPVHIQYKVGEVDGLQKDSTLMVESRTTIINEKLSEPIGRFNDDNWVKAATGMVLQTPNLISAFENGVQNTSIYKFLSTMS